MKQIHLDASAWSTEEDFYSALLPKLGAPDWHGRNLNALYDSFSGGINEVEAPFRVSIEGTANLNPELTAFLDDLAEVFATATKQFSKDVTLVIA